MSTTAERINNAIAALDWRAPAKPEGVRTAITDLAKHWASYWNSAERRLSPPQTQITKLQRYAAWYARAWALLPPERRGEFTHPRDVDATLWAALEDVLVYNSEGGQAAARATAEGAKALAREVGNVGATLVKGVVILGGVAIAGMAVYALTVKPRWL